MDFTNDPDGTSGSEIQVSSGPCCHGEHLCRYVELQGPLMGELRRRTLEERTSYMHVLRKNSLKKTFNHLDLTSLGLLKRLSQFSLHKQIAVARNPGST